MNKVRMARPFALAGFLISILFYVFWNLDDKFNFFHLPTADAAPLNYTQPASRAFLEKLNFVLCPPYVVTSFAGMDLGWTANLILWAVSLALNTVLYFIIGTIVGSLWNELARFWKEREA
jgi:hypothetical protein